MGSYPLSSQAPTHVEVELGCDNYFMYSMLPLYGVNSDYYNAHTSQKPMENYNTFQLKQVKNSLFSKDIVSHWTRVISIVTQPDHKPHIINP